MAMGWAIVGAGRFVEGLAGICPVKWMGHCDVVIVQEVAEFLLQIGHAGEVASPHDLSHDDPKHRLNLVQPRAVFGQIHEPNGMGWIAQKSTTRRL